jgi:hypothetical protein
MPRRTIPDRRRSLRARWRHAQPEHDSDDEFGDGIDWGDEPEIDAAASCNLENPEECEACQ